VKGIIVDPSGGAVGQATLTLTSVETGLTRTQRTDSEGRFTFDQLGGGDFTLQAEAAGFRPASAAAHVRTGETVDFTIRLELGAVTETIVVYDAASKLDNTNSQMQLSVEGPILRALPVRRDAIQFVQIAPGVAPVGPANPLQGEGMFNVHGGRGRGNNIT